MDIDDIDEPWKRLKWARKRAGYDSAEAYSQKRAINSVTYRFYENGTNGFTRKATVFAKDFGVSTDWLLDGGPIPDDVEDMGRQHVAARTAFEELQIEMIPSVDISYAMGDGAIVADYPETGMHPFSRDFLSAIGVRNTEGLILCRGEGDSMAPTIFDNDLVMVDTKQQRVTMQDRIWALAVAGAGMIKRVRMLPDGQILVLSDNPSVSDQLYNADDVYVVGRIMWIGRRM